MEQLIPVINRLQDVFSTIGLSHESIDLPQIVVVGSQSAGKSSVLENIVGRDFLPRGSGIVTRRPLVLQLINTSAEGSVGHTSLFASDGKTQEWGEFLHKPGEIFTDFNNIREEIQRETDRITGKNKGISPNPINLKIFSPTVLNLTLVDLPGITRIPIGDQAPDIEIQIRRMINTYIEKHNTIIVAVTAANSDMSTSDALQMAKEADPAGVRTIGVLTKIDIMDRGTDALDMLNGHVVPLKLGFIGVINRSQQDIVTKKPIGQSLKEEAEYFKTHPQYRAIASRCGTPFLAKTLNKILLAHIRDTLPDLKAKVSKLMQEKHLELISYGESYSQGPNARGALLLQILTKFAADYRDAIEGKLTEISLNELCGGARINYIFNEIFGVCLNTIQPTDGLTVNDIRTAIRNATGPRAALFVPEVSFELLVKKQITRLEEPSLQCIELVFDELQRIVTQLESKELLRFQTLRERVVETFNQLLVKCRTPTKKMIFDLIATEMAYINTNHPDFVGGGGAINSIFEKMAMQAAQNQQQEYMQQQQQQQQMQQGGQYGNSNGQPNYGNQPQAPQPGQRGGVLGTFFSKDSKGAPPVNRTGQPSSTVPPRSAATSNFRQNPAGGPNGVNRGRLDQVPATIKSANSPTDKEQFETDLIQSLLVSYFDIVRKNMKDMVPKAIMHFLVNTSRDSLQHELVSALYKEDLLSELLEESPLIAEKRDNCQKMLDVLRKANEVLNEVRDFNVK